MCYSQPVIPMDYGRSHSQHTAYFPREQIQFHHHHWETDTRLSNTRALVRFGLTTESDSCMETLPVLGCPRGAVCWPHPTESKRMEGYLAALMATEEWGKQPRPDVVNQAWLAKGCLGYRDSLRAGGVAVRASLPIANVALSAGCICSEGRGILG